MLYGVLPRPDARLLPQVLSPHPAPHPGPRTRPRASAPAPRLALWFSRSGPRIRSSHSCLRTPVSALLPPHSCLRTPASAPRPALRSRVPGGALRSRAPTQTCPHILPRALGGGFEGRILEGGFRVPGSSSGPRVLALCSGPHNPVLAPRLLAFRPASASHFDPRTPARTPVPCSGRCAPVSRSGPVFRAAYPGPVLRPRPAPHILPHALGGGFWRRLLRVEPALRPPHSGPAHRPAHRPPHPASRFGLRTPARPQVLHSGPVFREGRLLRFEPALRSSHPVLALLSPHSCLRTPASAPRPALRSRVPGGALRSRAPTQTCPHILPRALGGGFEGRILEGGFRVPGSSSGPRVLALCSGPHNPVLAPRLLAFRPASASHFDPRTPARTPVPCSGRCAPVSRSGPVFRAAYPGPVLRPRPAPHILPHALGGGFWRRLLPPGPLPHFVPRSRPRAPAPAFPPRISGGGFEGRFSGNILECRIPGGCFEGGGLRSGSCVRPRRCVSELRILANQQNKIYL